MKVICNKCGYEFDLEDSKKCPRCNAIIEMPKGCENCKGCSMFKSCNVDKKG